MAKGGGNQGAELSEEFKKLTPRVQYAFQEYFNGSLVEVAKTSTGDLTIYYFRDWDLLGKVFKNPPRRKGEIDDSWWATFERKLKGKLNAQKTISTTEDHVHALSELRKANDKLKMLNKGNVSQNTDVVGQNAEIARLTKELGTTKLQLSAETANRQTNRRRYEEDLQRLRETYEGERAAYKESLNIKMNDLTEKLTKNENDLQTTKDKYQAAIEKDRSTIADLRAEKAKAVSELNASASAGQVEEMDRLNQQVKDLTHAHDMFQSKSMALEKENMRLRKEQGKVEDASASSDENYARLNNDLASKNTEYWQLKRDYEALENANKSLQANLDYSDNIISNDRAASQTRIKSQKKRIEELESALKKQPGVDDNSDGGGGEMADNIAGLMESTKEAEDRLELIENDQEEHVRFRDATSDFVNSVGSAVKDLERIARENGVDVTAPPPYHV